MTKVIRIIFISLSPQSWKPMKGLRLFNTRKHLFEIRETVSSGKNYTGE